MSFSGIRFLLWIILSAITLYKIKTSKIIGKKLVYFLTVFIWLILVSLTAVFPVENLFINFTSPESVFRYTCSGNIDGIVHGNESCMIIYSKRDGSSSSYIVPKSDGGYKIPRYLDVKTVTSVFDSDGFWKVYRAERANDHYILGMFYTENTKVSISDSNGRTVETIVENIDEKGVKHVTCFAYVDDFSNEYYLLIDGKKVSLR